MPRKKTAAAEKPIETKSDGFSLGLNLLFGGRLEAAQNVAEDKKTAAGESGEVKKNKGGRPRKKAEPAVIEEAKPVRRTRKKAEPIAEPAPEKPKNRGGRPKKQPIAPPPPPEPTPIDLKDEAYIKGNVDKLKIALATQMVDVKFIFKRPRLVIGLESKEDFDRIVKLIGESHEKDVAKKKDLLRSASLKFSQ